MWQERPTLLLRGEKGGQVAWGEAAPLDGFGPETLKDVLAEIQRPDGIETSQSPALRCAMGTIRMGLKALEADTAFGYDQEEPSLDILTPAALEPENAALQDTAAMSASPVVKWKVGRRSVDEDITSILAFLRGNPNTSVRLDANGLLDRAGAVQLIAGLAGYETRIDCFEEPWNGCFEQDCRGVLPVPVGIDESLLKDNWLNADVVVLKPSLKGDPADTLEHARSIQASGRRVVISSAFESHVGMKMLTWLAAHLGDAAPGLGTYTFISDDWPARSSIWDHASIATSELPQVPSAEDQAQLAFPGEQVNVTRKSGLAVREITW